MDGQTPVWVPPPRAVLAPDCAAWTACRVLRARVGPHWERLCVPRISWPFWVPREGDPGRGRASGSEQPPLVRPHDHMSPGLAREGPVRMRPSARARCFLVAARRASSSDSPASSGLLQYPGEPRRCCWRCSRDGAFEEGQVASSDAEARRTRLAGSAMICASPNGTGYRGCTPCMQHVRQLTAPRGQSRPRQRPASSFEPGEDFAPGPR